MAKDDKQPIDNTKAADETLKAQGVNPDNVKDNERDKLADDIDA